MQLTTRESEKPYLTWGCENMESEFDLKFCNGMSFVWEREREEERAARFFGGKKGETPDPHYED